VGGLSHGIADCMSGLQIVCMAGGVVKRGIAWNGSGKGVSVVVLAAGNGSRLVH